MCALRTYFELTWDIRLRDQLFVCVANPAHGKEVSKQSLSHWVVEAIALAYSGKGYLAVAAPTSQEVWQRLGHCLKG